MPPVYPFPLLADASLNGEVKLIIYGIGVAVALALPNLVKTILDIVKHFKKDPPEHERFASRAEFQNLQAKVDALATRSELAGLRSHIDTTSGKLAADIAAVLVEVRPLASREEVHEIETRSRETEVDIKNLLKDLASDMRGLRNEVGSVNTRLAHLEGAYKGPRAGV